MNTLYITDLDGTLLQPNVQLSKRTVRILNDLIQGGVNFTIATARSIASVRTILQNVDLQLPVILMNGVCIYDFTKEKYLNVETLSPSSSELLLSILKAHKLKGFAYTMENGELSTYYEELSNCALKAFHDERVKLYRKPFQQIQNFNELAKKPLIYFTMMDKKEKLDLIYPVLEQAKDLNYVMYKDNYSQDLWLLEIFSKNASKYHGVQYLRSHLKPKQIICFGDNRNDLPLFEASDFRIAVANAVDELKEKADQVVGANTEDGVSLWLQFNALKSL